LFCGLFGLCRFDWNYNFHWRRFGRGFDAASKDEITGLGMLRDHAVFEKRILQDEMLDIDRASLDRRQYPSENSG
jgi:hypothetical protein